MERWHLACWLTLGGSVGDAGSLEIARVHGTQKDLETELASWQGSAPQSVQFRCFSTCLWSGCSDLSEHSVGFSRLDLKHWDFLA